MTTDSQIKKSIKNLRICGKRFIQNCIDFSFHAIVQKITKIPELCSLAPMGSSSFFLWGSEKKLLQTAGKWMAENYWLFASKKTSKIKKNICVMF